MCLTYKENVKFSIKDHTTMGRSKICTDCCPDQKDVPIPERAVLYICGYYDSSVNQRYVKFGYTTKSAQDRLRAVVKSWAKSCNELPYSEVLMEIEVPALESYRMEQEILKTLKESYVLSAFHKGMNIEGKKETFIIDTKENAREFVNKVEMLIKEIVGRGKYATI